MNFIFKIDRNKNKLDFTTFLERKIDRKCSILKCRICQLIEIQTNLKVETTICQIDRKYSEDTDCTLAPQVNDHVQIP